MVDVSAMDGWLGSYPTWKEEREQVDVGERKPVGSPNGSTVASVRGGV